MDGLFKGLFGLGGQSMYANPAEEARVRNQRAYPAGASGPTFDAADTRGFGQKMSDALMGLGSRQGWQDYAASTGGTKPQYSEEMVNQLLGTITPFGLGIKAAKSTTPLGDLYYRGESSVNSGPFGSGKHYSTDREFAQQFTQRGLDSEVKTARVRQEDIFVPKESVYAGDVEAMDKAIQEAKNLGFKGVRLTEGVGQPDSIFIFNRSAIGK